jgi:predicted TIM-barrel fold metal-dependent hydrolase
LQAILERNRFDGAILVVDAQDLPAVEPQPHILGVVARIGETLDLDQYRKHAAFRGVCCSLEGGIPAGLEELARRGIPLDVEMRPADFPALLRLAQALPALRIAIGHLARPGFHGELPGDWARGMEAAARWPQVFCKISGLLTEVERLPWSAAPIRPLVQHALSVFGPQRLMFGSEWPRCLPGATWKETLAAFTQAIGPHSLEVREQLLGETARAFYGM